MCWGYRGSEHLPHTGRTLAPMFTMLRETFGEQREASRGMGPHLSRILYFTPAAPPGEPPSGGRSSSGTCQHLKHRSRGLDLLLPPTPGDRHLPAHSSDERILYCTSGYTPTT
uniref:uncharacterized protein LOC706446 isoform X2 n=1 Tax=Macaca mulatta TaxID=9544 RepID=UPI0010A22C89|nr:uncharacterized protein LOC706446 isoform X2 [Macaca mulatta]